MKTSRRSFLKLSGAAASLAASVKAAPAVAAASVPGKKFYRGMFHCHTYWSDGRAFPEQVIRIYQSLGYDFLGLSDHNVYGDARRVRDVASVDPAIYRAYLKEFPDMVETATGTKGQPGVVLSTVAKLRRRFERPGKFLMLDAVEATTTINHQGVRNQIHMNYVNLPGKLPYLDKLDKADTVERRIRSTDRAVTEFATQLKRDSLFVVNHPIWEWYDIVPEDLIANPQVRFFEQCNCGSSYAPASELPKDGLDTDRFWDIVNAFRARRGEPLLYGVGNDDTHHYFGLAGSLKTPPHGVPGNAWSYVRAEALTSEALLKAMKAGDFACCEGLEPQDFAFDRSTGTLTVSVAGAADLARTIEFVVTKKDFSEKPLKTIEVTAKGNDKSKALQRRINIYDMSKIGVVAKRVVGEIGEAVQAAYTLAPDDLYVRARIISPERSRAYIDLHPRVKMCWTQPYSRTLWD